jgi:hypothetical protein
VGGAACWPVGGCIKGRDVRVSIDFFLGGGGSSAPTSQNMASPLPGDAQYPNYTFSIPDTLFKGITVTPQ